MDNNELASYAKNWGKSLLIRGNSMCEDQEVGKSLAVWLERGKSVSEQIRHEDGQRGGG